MEQERRQDAEGCGGRGYSQTRGFAEQEDSQSYQTWQQGALSVGSFFQDYHINSFLASSDFWRLLITFADCVPEIIIIFLQTLILKKSQQMITKAGKITQYAKS